MRLALAISTTLETMTMVPVGYNKHNIVQTHASRFPEKPACWRRAPHHQWRSIHVCCNPQYNIGVRNCATLNSVQRPQSTCWLFWTTRPRRPTIPIELNKKLPLLSELNVVNVLLSYHDSHQGCIPTTTSQHHPSSQELHRSSGSKCRHSYPKTYPLRQIHQVEYSTL